MLLVCHHPDPRVPEDIASAESRIRAETIAAVDIGPLRDRRGRRSGGDGCADVRRTRGARPVVFSNLKTGLGLDVIANFVEVARQMTSRSPSGL